MSTEHRTRAGVKASQAGAVRLCDPGQAGCCEPSTGGMSGAVPASFVGD